jgi:hypothetical protein
VTDYGGCDDREDDLYQVKSLNKNFTFFINDFPFAFQAYSNHRLNEKLKFSWVLFGQKRRRKSVGSPRPEL